MLPSNLIINADDFGLDLEMSRQIAQCARDGIVNSISVLPFPKTDRDHEKLLHKIILENPNIKIGAHLSLIETLPTLIATPRYSNKRASPKNFKEFLKMYLVGRLSRKQIYNEWKSQLHWLKERLRTPHKICHIDSHQHIHILPGIWGVVLKLQQEFGVNRIRIPFEGAFNSFRHQFPFGAGLQIISAIRKFQYTGEPVHFRGIKTSTNFEFSKYSSLPENILHHPKEKFELMVHPGYPLRFDAKGTEIDFDKNSYFQRNHENRELKVFKEKFTKLKDNLQNFSKT